MPFTPEPDAPFAELVWLADNAKNHEPIRHGRAKNGGAERAGCQCPTCRDYRRDPTTRARRRANEVRWAETRARRTQWEETPYHPKG